MQSAGGRARFAIGAIYTASAGTAMLLSIEILEAMVLEVPMEQMPEDDRA